MSGGKYQIEISVDGVPKLVSMKDTLRQIATATAATQQSIDSLAKVLDSTNRRISNNTTAFNRMTKAMRTATGDIDRVRKAKESAAAATGKYSNFMLGLQKAATLTAGPLSGIGARIATINSVMGNGEGNIVRYTVALTAAAAAGTALIQQGERFQMLQNRLKQVTDSSESLAATTNALFDTANKNRQSIEATTDVYFRLARAMDGSGVSQGKLLVATDAVTKAVALSGTTASSASAALFQFGQGLASGQLRGQELNSVLEQTPRLAQALADGIEGVNGDLGKLRALSRAGGLDTETVFVALLSQSVRLEEEFAKLTPTVSQALEVLGNNFTKVVGGESVGALGKLSEAILFVANNLENALNAVLILGVTVVTARFIPALGRAAAAIIGFSSAITAASATTAAAGGVMALSATRTAALSASFTAALGPIGLLVAAVTGLSLAYSSFGDETVRVDTRLLESETAYEKYLIYLQGAEKQTGALKRETLALAESLKTAQLALIDSDIAKVESQMRRVLYTPTQILSALGSGLLSGKGAFNESLKASDIQDIKEYRSASEKLFALQKERQKFIDSQERAAKGRTDLTKSQIDFVDEIYGKSKEKQIKDATMALDKLKAARDRASATGDTETYKRAVVAIGEQQTELDKLTGATDRLKDAEKSRSHALREATKSQKEYDSFMEDVSPVYKRKQALAELAAFEQKYAKQLQKDDPSGSIMAAKRAEIEKEFLGLPTKEKAEEGSKEVQRIFENAATNIQNSFASMFENVFEKGFSSFEDFGDDIKNVFKKTLAQMATLAIARPLILPMVTSLGSAMGLDANAMTGITKQFGGEGGTSASGSLSTISSMFSAGSLLFNKGAAASMGSTLLSLGGGAPSLPFGGFGTASALSNFAGVAGSIGGIGAGFAGNFLANSIFGNNRGIGAGIGGTLGGIGGGLLAASPLLGLGPVGIAAAIGLGAFGGNALGGLFGGKKPSNKTQSFNVNLATGRTQYNELQSLTGKKFSQENADAAEGIAGFANSVAQAAGGLTESLRIAVGANGYGFQFGDASQFRQNQQRDTKQFTKVDDFYDALVTTIAEKANVDSEIAKAIDKVDFSDLEKALADIDFIFQFKNLTFAKDNTTEFERTLATLNKSYDTAIAKAKELGLNEEKLTENRAKQLQVAKDTFLAQTNRAIMGIVDPSAANLLALDDSFIERRRDASLQGSESILATERLYALQRAQIIEQSLQETNQVIGQTFKDQMIDIQRIRDSIALNASLSVGNRGTVAAAAQNQFDRLATRIAANDNKAFGELDSTINEYLQASLDFYGPSEQYLKNLDSVQQLLTSAEGKAKSQLDYLQEISGFSEGTESLLKELVAKSNATSQMITGLDRTSPNLLRSGETLAQIQGQKNALNNLPEDLVRALKVQASGGAFNFRTATGSFADFVKAGNRTAGENFLTLLEKYGGEGITEQRKAFGFARGTGGRYIRGQFWAGEQGAELITARQPMAVYSNGESQAITGMQQFNTEMRQYRVQSKQETKELTDALKQMTAELAEMRLELATMKVANG